MITTVINLWGGPGCGKSVLAAQVYEYMSCQGLLVEMVREFVKPHVWRGDTIGRWDEEFIFASQLHQEACLYGKVQYIVTDRPLGMSMVYEEMYAFQWTLMRDHVPAVLAEQYKDGIKHINLRVQRRHDYVALGRNESEMDAIRVDELCAKYVPTKPVTCVSDVMERLQC